MGQTVHSPLQPLLEQFDLQYLFQQKYWQNQKSLLSGAANMLYIAFRECISANSSKILVLTLTKAVDTTLEASKVRFSTVLSNRMPSEFASILTPLSFVETANKIPSLLNLIQGEACKYVKPE